MEILERFGRLDKMFAFHHVDPSDKHSDYDNLIRRTVISREQLDELDKCVLLCQVCHGAVHAQRLTAEMEVVMRLGRRKTSQRLKGDIVADLRERKLTFLSSDRLLIKPYGVKIGASRPKLFFGTELYHDHVLTQAMDDLPRTGRVVVKDWHTGEWMLTATHDQEYGICLAHSVRFEMITADLCTVGPKSPIAWIRNGLAVLKDGTVTDQGTVTYRGGKRRSAVDPYTDRQ